MTIDTKKQGRSHSVRAVAKTVSAALAMALVLATTAANAGIWPNGIWPNGIWPNGTGNVAGALTIDGVALDGGRLVLR